MPNSKDQTARTSENVRSGVKSSDKLNQINRSNGNQASVSDDKKGGAERGGPGLDKARDRQPPESTR